MRWTCVARCHTLEMNDAFHVMQTMSSGEILVVVEGWEEEIRANCHVQHS